MCEQTESKPVLPLARGMIGALVALALLLLQPYKSLPAACSGVMDPVLFGLHSNHLQARSDRLADTR